MKNQLLKLALLGLFGTFGYSDGDFDIDKDGKVDKIGFERYFSIDGKKLRSGDMFTKNISTHMVISKYRNKKLSETWEYKIDIKGKKYFFLLKKTNQIDSKGEIIDYVIWENWIQPLGKKEKGLKLIISPYASSHQHYFNLKYENNRFYITQIRDTDSKRGCITYLSQKIPLPKIINVDKIYDLYEFKKSNRECIDTKDSREKGFDMKLYKRVYGR
jgi:hypothetical protein